MKRPFHSGKWAALFIAILLATSLLFLYNCGGGYTDPQSQVASSSVLISPAQLNAWITNGYGTDGYGYNKMVILDVANSTGTSSYSVSGHVPQAFLLDIAVNLSATENDGVSPTISDVATQAQMNNLLQTTGIDANTVVVLTGDLLHRHRKGVLQFPILGISQKQD